MSVYDDAQRIVLTKVQKDPRAGVAQALIDLVDVAETAVRLHDESRFKEQVEWLARRVALRTR